MEPRTNYNDVMQALRINLYNSSCVVCGKKVPAGKGTIVKHGGSIHAKHHECIYTWAIKRRRYV